eukprot:scaffold109_cov368-Pavlova_lutheri.AAC.23
MPPDEHERMVGHHVRVGEDPPSIHDESGSCALSLRLLLPRHEVVGTAVHREHLHDGVQHAIHLGLLRLPRLLRLRALHERATRRPRTHAKRVRRQPHGCATHPRRSDSKVLSQPLCSIVLATYIITIFLTTT